MLKQYQEIIIEHLNNVETIEFGRYRLEGSWVFYNKITGMAAVIDKDGNFVTAFIPKDEPDMKRFQLSNYLKSGYLRWQKKSLLNKNGIKQLMRFLIWSHLIQN